MVVIEEEVLSAQSHGSAALNIYREAVPLNEGDGRARNNRKSRLSDILAVQNYSASKTVATGLMDIALLSANANQLRFLLTYNHEAATFITCLVLVILSLVLQVLVGFGMIFKKPLKQCLGHNGETFKEVLVLLVFLITAINVLLAAFTTTDGKLKH